MTEKSDPQKHEAEPVLFVQFRVILWIVLIRAEHETTYTTQTSLPVYQTQSRSLIFLAALGPVEKHPDGQIIAEVLKPMFDFGGDKKHVVGRERLPNLAANKITAPFGDDIISSRE